MITTQLYNMEVQEGLTTCKTFYFKDNSTGLPADLKGYEVEVRIKFEHSQETIIYSSTAGVGVVVDEINGAIALSIPWMGNYYSGLGTGSYGVYGKSRFGFSTLLAKGLYTVIENSLSLPTDPVAAVPPTVVSAPPLRVSIRKVTKDYELTIRDSTLLVDAKDNPLMITLPDLVDSYANTLGSVFSIKRIDSSTNEVLLAGIIDGEENLRLSGKNTVIQIQGFEDGYYSLTSVVTYVPATPVDPEPGTPAINYSFIAAIF